jgi:transposase
MEVVHPRCAGVDISKKDAKVCVRIQGRGSRATAATVSTWGSMTNQILALREHLLAEKVTCVVMEATSDYWKPFFYLLEDVLPVMLVNAHHAKNMPGRKSDVSDSAWLADLGAHGLLRGSLVPPPPIRRLRDLTRARTALTRDRGRQVQRIEKILEDVPLTELPGGLVVSCGEFRRGVVTVSCHGRSSGYASGPVVVGGVAAWVG